MLEKLILELAAIGLDMNGDKTKVLTSDPDFYNEELITAKEIENCDISFELDVAGIALKCLDTNQAHKYLGRLICFNPEVRAETEINHRILAGWANFCKHRHALTNRNTSLALRLKLFDSVVTPAVLYGLAALTFASGQIARLDRVQNKMLRAIVGWVRLENEEWRDTMSRMKKKVCAAKILGSILDWSAELSKRKWRLAGRVATLDTSRWPRILAEWTPNVVQQLNGILAKRKVGRPRTRWEDNLDEYSKVKGYRDWLHFAQGAPQHLAHI